MLFCMPTGTSVDRCYQKLKGQKGEGHAAAICQASTGQSLKTGQSLAEKLAEIDKYCGGEGSGKPGPCATLAANAKEASQMANNTSR